MENSTQSQVPPSIPSPVSLFDRIANSVVLKMITIFILILILLIPMHLVDDLVYERKAREQNVTAEIAAKWGRDQVLSSPVLAVPYLTTKETVERTEQGKEQRVKSVVEEWAFLLSEKDVITTDVKPEYLKRGIYNSVVYNSTTQIKGNFGGFDLAKIPVESGQINWAGAKLILGVQDLKGVLSSPSIQIGAERYVFQKDASHFDLFPNALTVDLHLKDAAASKFSFVAAIELRGSKSLNILPLANQTEINAKGTWGNPSFNGGFLPEDRQVSDSSFDAKWSVPSFSRKAPQQWFAAYEQLYRFSGISLADETDYYQTDAMVEQVSEAATSQATLATATDVDMVQINFLPEVNNYQKATRATKYGILIIVLTFVSLFFTEIIKKQRVHLIQYLLIGAAMVLFYSLLLAFSEHFGFNIAYLVAAIATIVLIAGFIKAITKNNNTSLLFAAILSLFYTFIYVLMQLRDYSLIVGTVGVFVILAVLMKLSTKINWYQFDRK